MSSSVKTSTIHSPAFALKHCLAKISCTPWQIGTLKFIEIKIEKLPIRVTQAKQGQTGPSGAKLSQIGSNGAKRGETGRNGTTQGQMGPNGPNWAK